MSRLDQVKLAFAELDEEKKGTLRYHQVQKLLITFGVRPAEQMLAKHMSLDDRINADRVCQILDAVSPIGLVRSRLINALADEDSRQERLRRGFTIKASVDGLVSMNNVSSILTHYGLTQCEIDDALEPYKTSDNQVEYRPFVAAITDI